MSVGDAARVIRPYHYYGVQPLDNEHTFAAVLSQKETEKMEKEREEEMRR